MIHCKGEFCPVRDVCTNNQIFNSTLTQIVDWSIEGSGSASEGSVNFTPYCGPRSDPPYARFQDGNCGIDRVDHTLESNSAIELMKPQSCSNVSEVPLSEVLDTICQMWSPVKITYNDKVLYNDFDADSGVEIREGEFYGETRAPQLVVKERAFGLLNKVVHSIVIDYVDFHHSVITIKGES